MLVVTSLLTFLCLFQSIAATASSASPVDTFGYYARTEGVGHSIADELMHFETKAELGAYINSPYLSKMWDYYAFDLAQRFYTTPLHSMFKVPPRNKQFEKAMQIRSKIDKAIEPITAEAKKNSFRSFLETWIGKFDVNMRGITEFTRYLLVDAQIPEMYAITRREEGAILLGQAPKRMKILFHNAWDAYLYEMALDRVIQYANDET